MRRRSNNSHRADRGQMMVLAALVLPVFLGGAAMAVDVGVMWAVEARLRTVADAGAGRSRGVGPGQVEQCSHDRGDHDR